jgi:hypothetical protein
MLFNNLANTWLKNNVLGNNGVGGGGVTFIAVLLQN